MLEIMIQSQFENEDDMAMALEIISRLLRDGYQCGNDPDWHTDEVYEGYEEEPWKP